jgi:Family of unknown function (DUF6496)
MPWDQVLHKFKEGTLKSGSGKPVTRREQAIAIMEDEREKAKEGNSEYQSSGDRMAALVKKRKG